MFETLLLALQAWIGSDLMGGQHGLPPVCRTIHRTQRRGSAAPRGEASPRLTQGSEGKRRAMRAIDERVLYESPLPCTRRGFRYRRRRLL